jgi:uncharacterized RDD family membrane protein YckC
MEHDLRISTAEHVGISYELAGVGSRVLAAFLDVVAISVVELGGTLLANGGSRQLGSLLGRSIFSAIVTLLFLLVFPLAYWVLLETLWNGQTLGKRLVGIRVLRDTGAPAGFIAITARGLVRLLDVVPFVLPIDILLIVLTGKSQRLGDLVAGTVVVKARVQRDFLALRTQVPAAAGDLTVRGLSGEAQRLVREFVLREAGLRPQARVVVAGNIARTVRPAVPEQATHPDDVEFLRAVAAALRVHSQEGAAHS